MDSARSSDLIGPRLAVLWASLLAGSSMLAFALTSGSGVINPYRTVAALVLTLLAGYELLGHKRTEVLLVGAGVTYSVLSMVEMQLGTATSFFDPGMTLGLLIVVGVLFASTRANRRVAPVVAYSIGVGLYSIASFALQDLPFSHVIGQLLIGVVGQGVAIWVTVRIIDRLAASADDNAKSLAIQKALARCSHLLLVSREERGAENALAALLDATEADYAYIDVNRMESDGRVSWQIIHQALGANVPEGPSAFASGDYDDLPWVQIELSAGRPVRIRVSELKTPIRTRYESEGIRAELAAPIMVGEKWVGTIGFSDFWREGTWTELETDALLRAADMIAAAWERDRAREGLLALAESKDRFIAAVSHELRTPLSAVVGFAAALRDSATSFSTQEISEIASVISAQSQEVADLVEDLLTSERAASGNLTIRPVATDLEVELKSVIELALEPPPIRILRSVTVLADGLRTRQIIRNLLTNAARYGGSNVRIDVDAVGAMGRLTVLDDGKGILGMDEDRIFDPYYRSRSDVALTDSVGLGLAVARQLARLMGGDLIYQRQDGWTRFELTLPLDRNEPPAPVLSWDGPFDLENEIVPVTV